jgi:hypothetical protein
MANIFKDLLTRIKIDWIEWRTYQQSVWNVKRDKRAIKRAIYRAYLKNQSDGRTYYILRNLGGGFDEVNSEQLKKLKSKDVKYFPRYQDYNTMLKECFAIITSNSIIRNSYIETIKTINQNDTENK